MAGFNDKRGIKRLSLWLQEGVFFLVCLFLLMSKVHPLLVIDAQSPVFLKGIDFLTDFLKIPGGLTDWLSALFMQFWFTNTVGACLLAASFWAVAFLTRKWMETLGDKLFVHTFHLIPMILLLGLQYHFEFRAGITLALIINLLFLSLFLRLAPAQKLFRAAFGLTISLILYWTTGGAFLIFAILCAIDEILLRKQLPSGIALLLTAAFLPFLTSSSIFLITLKQAYFHNLIFENPNDFGLPGYALYAFFPLVLITMVLKKYTGFRIPVPEIGRLAYIWKLAAGSAVLIAGIILLTRMSGNETERKTLQINRAVKENRWSDVLETARSSSNVTPVILCQTNLALFEKGILLDSMFIYPQTRGNIGLRLSTSWCASWPKEASDLFWKLGLVNESLHWAHEAMELKGPSPDILKRLGEIYMLKDENRAASHFFMNLMKVPFHAESAERMIALNENPKDLSETGEYSYIKTCMPVDDLLLPDESFSVKLEHLLKRNPGNKMAFEYLIASHLLNADIRAITEKIPAFFAMKYARIPHHVQEALVVAATMIRDFDLKRLKGIIDPSTLNSFAEFRQIVYKYGNDKARARQELITKFAGSYWCYLMYAAAAQGQTETPHEYQ